MARVVRRAAQATSGTTTSTDGAAAAGDREAHGARGGQALPLHSGSGCIMQAARGAILNKIGGGKRSMGRPKGTLWGSRFDFETRFRPGLR